MRNSLFESYIPPQLEVVEMVVEQGFSNSLQDPVENPEIEW